MTDVSLSPEMAEGHIIVTGASRGIGAAIATELVNRGRKVVCLSRSGVGPASHNIVCDMTDELAVQTAVAKVARLGPITGLINNAGIHLRGPTADLSTIDFERVMSLNTTAVMVASREVYPHFRSAGGGIIINIGSFFDKLGVRHNLAYSASKAAVGAITRCLATEWAAEGITVVNVAPGYIETDLNRNFLVREGARQWTEENIPTGRVGQAQEVARLVAALVIENILFLTGETIYLDGGQGMSHG